MKPTFVVYGNCNAQALTQFLEALTPLGDSHEIIWARSYGDTSLRLPGVENDPLARCEHLWVQNDEQNPMIHEGRTPESCSVLRFPPCNSTVLWPYQFRDSLPVGPDAVRPEGNFPYGDDLIRRLSEDPAITPQNVVEAYQAQIRSGHVANAVEQNQRLMAERDAACDVSIADFFWGNFRRTPMQMTFNHPRRAFVQGLFFRMLDRTAPDLTAAAREKADQWPATYEPFDNFETPVAPAVADALQLEWWTPDHKYIFWDERLTFAEYLVRYLEDRRRRLAQTGA
ncbi:hypothetical protein ASD89_07655 [Caulobacter sp. Root656]|nr:hypothetical protein ASD89_07655 [Caulobacter sp. Root656]